MMIDDDDDFFFGGGEWYLLRIPLEMKGTREESKT